MSEPKEIPSATLNAAIDAILKVEGYTSPIWATGEVVFAIKSKAEAVLEAARVPQMLADRERIGLVLFQNGYDAGYTTDGAIEAIEAMAARIAELEAKLTTANLFSAGVV